MIQEFVVSVHPTAKPESIGGRVSPSHTRIALSLPDRSFVWSLKVVVVIRFVLAVESARAEMPTNAVAAQDFHEMRIMSPPTSARHTHG